MQKPLRIVNYAVDGVGTGHVTRLIAISRWLRRHTERLQVPVQIFFVTSTEAGALLFSDRFPFFKLPSRTVAAESALPEEEFLDLARHWVTQTIASLQPDLLIVDTFPQGYFSELEALLAQVHRTAFVYRPVKEAHARDPEFRSALSKYDLILVPEYEHHVSARLVTDVNEKIRYLGPIIVREKDEVRSRAEARRILGVPEDRLTVYITMGGGGDALAERQIQNCFEALRGIDGLRLIIGAGPLYRGRCIYDEQVLWLGPGCAAELMAGFDIAVSAAGYNSFNELMHFGVPTVFLPQEKWADDQKTRAERAARVGAAVVLNSLADEAQLRQAIETFRDPASRINATRAARELVPRNHACTAASALLRLLMPEAKAFS